MKYSKTTRSALICGACLLAAAAVTARAANITLHTGTVTKTMPDGTDVVMWGFGLGADPTPVTVPGPAIQVDPSDTTLTIELHNYLLVPVSIVIPGQAPAVGSIGNPERLTADIRRARSFTAEAGASDGAVATVASYSWTVQPGTYLYHSGSHAAVQVQMGLYGAMTKDAVSAAEPYAGTNVASQVTLLYSEIDPAVHEAVAGGTYGTSGGMTSTIRSKAKYYLINGVAYPDPQTAFSNPIASPGSTVLLRFLNAGLDYHVPILVNNDLRLIAEDGNLYNHPRDSYAVELAPMKTIDALWVNAPAGTFALYDRRLGLSNGAQHGGGMLTKLQIQ